MSKNLITKFIFSEFATFSHFRNQQNVHYNANEVMMNEKKSYERNWFGTKFNLPPHAHAGISPFFLGLLEL